MGAAGQQNALRKRWPAKSSDCSRWTTASISHVWTEIEFLEAAAALQDGAAYALCAGTDSNETALKSSPFCAKSEQHLFRFNAERQRILRGARLAVRLIDAEFRFFNVITVTRATPLCAPPAWISIAAGNVHLKISTSILTTQSMGVTSVVVNQHSETWSQTWDRRSRDRGDNGGA